LEPDQPSEQLNYFNYFTEIEEHFQRARGTSLFLLSPLDWALIETWKEANVPLEAVLRGIDVAFEKWRAKKQRGRQVNSLAYCAQAVTEEAERMAGNVPAGRGEAEAPFSLEELREFLSTARARVNVASVAAELDAVLANLEQHYAKLEELEQRLSALEDKLLAVVRAAQPESELLEARRELDAHLRPYRGKMSAAQLAMLEKQYLDRWLFERHNLPRLSLFYLR
jgi:DNA repair exonuclease SbcCD ATPase subunit